MSCNKPRVIDRKPWLDSTLRSLKPSTACYFHRCNNYYVIIITPFRSFDRVNNMIVLPCLVLYIKVAQSHETFVQFEIHFLQDSFEMRFANVCFFNNLLRYLDRVNNMIVLPCLVLRIKVPLSHYLNVCSIWDPFLARFFNMRFANVCLSTFFLGPWSSK